MVTCISWYAWFPGTGGPNLPMLPCPWRRRMEPDRRAHVGSEMNRSVPSWVRIVKILLYPWELSFTVRSPYGGWIGGRTPGLFRWIPNRQLTKNVVLITAIRRSDKSHRSKCQKCNKRTRRTIANEFFLFVSTIVYYKIDVSAYKLPSPCKVVCYSIQDWISQLPKQQGYDDAVVPLL